jgi:hypothetical protein
MGLVADPAEDEGENERPAGYIRDELCGTGIADEALPSEA